MSLTQAQIPFNLQQLRRRVHKPENRDHQRPPESRTRTRSSTKKEIATDWDMMEKSSSQYDSFLFWRQPIPALDLAELADLGLPDCEPAKEKESMFKLRNQDEEAELMEFSSFNYWRAPLANVDALLADLHLLL